MTFDEVVGKYHRFVASNYNPLPVCIVFGEGCWVHDLEGCRYLDMHGNYSALNFGHRHPRLTKVLEGQSQLLTAIPGFFYISQKAELCEKLATLCGLDKVLLMNTGAEAFDSAVKIARRWGYWVKRIPEGKAEIVVCYDNFHGRTVAATSASYTMEYRDGFGPFLPGLKWIPFGDADALQSVIGPDTVAFIVEPIQGEGGINIPPDEYLKEIEIICRSFNVLLVLDEVQTGFGRTGENFAYEHEGVKPDLLLLGKALNGLGSPPTSAVVGRQEIMDVLTAGSHGSTFGGNPLACSLAIESIDVLLEESLAENARELGQYFLDELRKIKSPLIREVRGKGLLIAVELKLGTKPARVLCEELLKEGVLCCLRRDNVMSFAPPLIITKNELDYGLERVRKVFKSIEVRPR